MKQNLLISLYLFPFMAVCYDMVANEPSSYHLLAMLITFMIAFVGSGYATKV